SGNPQAHHRRGTDPARRHRGRRRLVPQPRGSGDDGNDPRPSRYREGNGRGVDCPLPEILEALGVSQNDGPHRRRPDGSVREGGSKARGKYDNQHAVGIYRAIALRFYSRYAGRRPVMATSPQENRDPWGNAAGVRGAVGATSSLPTTPVRASDMTSVAGRRLKADPRPQL